LVRESALVSKAALAGSLRKIAALAVVTGAVYLFREAVPVLSLGVLYLFAVLPVAVVWGRAYAILVAVASMLAFNFFFLPPKHTFRLEDTENWFALARLPRDGNRRQRARRTCPSPRC